MTKQELASALLLDTVSGHLNRTVSKLLDQKLIERTIPNNPNHPAQKFKLTERGKVFLELLKNEK
jgi:DNA-binding HxlR family transcriptional regulator